MSKHLAIFQVGPVQEFIQTAKKTIDYWSGSFMLSYFCATAICIIGKKRVVFPYVDKNPLFEKVDCMKGGLPWDNKTMAEAYRPTIPNRLLCQLDDGDEPGELLKNAKNGIITQWRDIAGKIVDAFPSSLEKNINSTWNDIWKRQTENPFEILYVWRAIGNGENYHDSYKRTEALMGSRKASRWFETVPAEKGHKCSLCGIREALHITSGECTRKIIRDDWENYVRKGSLRYQFRKGETLCAVCMIKRLAPKLVFDKPGAPSTSTVAVGKTVQHLQYLLSSETRGFQPLLQGFKQAVRSAAKQTDEPSTGIMQLPANEGPDTVLDMDGDWYFDTFYQNIKQKHKQDNDYPTIANAIERAQEKLREVIGFKDDSQACPPPARYYAILAADGDNMGKTLGEVEDIHKHKKISECMASFSLTTAFNILQKSHLGYVIYFGGDEGVAFITLYDLFEAMRTLREEWGKKVVTKLKDIGISSPPTLSVGVAIAHHQSGLRNVIAAAHEALEDAKDMDGKDAFCVHLMRRSSGKSISRAKWKSKGLSVLNLLKGFQSAYQDGYLSPSWISDLRAMEKAIGDPPEKLEPHETQEWIIDASRLSSAEIERLILRHSDPAFSKVVADLISNVLKLNEGLKTVSVPNGGTEYNKKRFCDIINMMDLAHYVAKGGGR